MDGVHFGVHQDQNFHKLNYQFLIKVARYVQSNQKRKLLNFCHLLRKSIETAFVSYCDAKHSDTYQDPVIVVVACFWVAVVRNGYSLLDQGTLKSAVSQEGEFIK